jgi:hypothetical protein
VKRLFKGEAYRPYRLRYIFDYFAAAIESLIIFLMKAADAFSPVNNLNCKHACPTNISIPLTVLQPRSFADFISNVFSGL